MQKGAMPFTDSTKTAQTALGGDRSAERLSWVWTVAGRERKGSRRCHFVIWVPVTWAYEDGVSEPYTHVPFSMSLTSVKFQAFRY